MRCATAGALTVLLVALSAPAMAVAQTCVGRAGPEAGNIQLSGDYSSTQGVSQFGVSGGGLGATGFGSVTVGSISYDDFAGSTLVLGAGAGYRLPVGTSGNAEICPVVSALLGMGPNDIEGSGVDASSRGAQIGLSAGYRIASGADMAIIPTVGVGFAYSAFKLTDGVDTLEDSDTYGAFNVGVGLVLGRQFTALPSVSIPVGLEDSDPVLSISFTLSLGTRR